jgi:C-terminal processing protease CtpA/Prc
MPATPAVHQAFHVQEFAVTVRDLQKMLGGEGGLDLERVVENGKQIAMRVIGLRPDTTAARLGARNGDTIETVNGLPMTSIALAYQAGDEALKDKTITIRGKRNGAPYETILHIKDL